MVLWTELLDFVEAKQSQHKERAEKKKWEHFPQYPNGTLITGRLTKSELETVETEAKSSRTQNPTVATSFPPEIIREIIRHATDTYPAPATIHCCTSLASPDPLPPSFASSFPYCDDAQSEDADVERKLHVYSMKIKRSCSLVSKTWRDLAVEFLYNSIRIHDSRQLLQLWHAFKCDARRNGRVASKETVGGPGSAAWWVRELWMDMGKKGSAHFLPERHPEPLSLFNLPDLLNMCPHIVVFRGFGRWPYSQLPLLFEDGVALKQILGFPEHGTGRLEAAPEKSGETAQHLEVPDHGRRISLQFLHYWDPFAPLIGSARVSLLPAAPLTVTLQCISYMELSDLFINEGEVAHDHLTVHLPNLTHLSIRGSRSLSYAAFRLVLPSIRSVTYASGATWPLGPAAGPYLKSFLENHGAGLEELTILDSNLMLAGSFQKMEDLCPVLRTFRCHFVGLPMLPLSNAETVGLYGLDGLRDENMKGQYLARIVFTAFPNVRVVQDSSWRSEVFRRRAFTNWRDPEGRSRRIFWASFLNAINLEAEKRTVKRDTELRSNKSVKLVDWRGWEIGPVPTIPPGEGSTPCSPDDWLMDSIVNKASFLNNRRKIGTQVDTLLLI